MTLYFPPQKFKPAPLPKTEWRRRWTGFAVADFTEGARRDCYAWQRFQEPFSVREALPAEYDGARLNAGLPLTEHRRALAIVRVAHGQIERFFLPLGSDESPDTYAPAHWFEIAVSWQSRTRDTVIFDTLPLTRGAQ